MTMLQRPSSASIRGATVVVIWAHQADEAQDVLYAGTQNGYFFGWRQKDGVRMLSSSIRSCVIDFVEGV
jgi:hypothetical protein